jgi:hypothetical protein
MVLFYKFILHERELIYVFIIVFITDFRKRYNIIRGKKKSQENSIFKDR